MESLTLKEVSYLNAKGLIHEIRNTVFIEEQNVPLELEFDDNDPISSHVVGFMSDKPVATGRIAPDGRIGRMAVLKEYRGRGIGGKVLEKLIKIGRESGLPEFYLAAQRHAVPFYEKMGFLAEGPIFREAGIDHQLMKKKI